jgi:hypothetical protein
MTEFASCFGLFYSELFARCSGMEGNDLAVKGTRSCCGNLPCLLSSESVDHYWYGFPLAPNRLRVIDFAAMCTYRLEMKLGLF